MSDGVFSLVTGGEELFDRVGPLWNQLRNHHAGLSERFGDQLRSIDFGVRREGLLKKAAGGLHVSLATAAGRDVGYSISLIDACAEGHIESLFVEESHRNLRIGDALMRNALAWFESRAIEAISLEVLVGNERVMRFYERFGFFPRTHRLRHVRNQTDGKGPFI